MQPEVNGERLANGRLRHAVFLGLASLAAGPASVEAADDLFELTATVLDTGETASRGFSEIEKFVEQLGNEGLSDLLGTYTDASAAVADLNVRGLPATVSYAAGSTTLVFEAPTCDVLETFTGATRDESEELFEDFLKGEGEEAVTDLLQCLVEQTPTDPVAGNPLSLMSRMAAADFAIGSGVLTIEPGEGEAEAPDLIGIGVRFDHASSVGFETNAVTLPLQYIATLPDPRWAVILDAPLTYIDIEGGNAYYGSFGAGLRIPLLDRWSLTPMARAGAVGSSDLGTVTAIYSGSVTSAFNIYGEDFFTDGVGSGLGDLKFSINNMAGYYITDSISAGDFHPEYDLENGIFKNGVSVEGSLGFMLFDDPTTWEIAFTDTRFAGHDMFIDQYNEFVVSFGTRRRATRMSWQSLRVGAGYTFADDYDGFHFSLNYRF